MTGDLVALLTRIRLPDARRDLLKAAKVQYLLPLVGAGVGLAPMAAALLLGYFFSSDLASLSGGIVLLTVYSVTGILHIEGLADFADGVMAEGTKDRKLDVMKDPHSGAAGIFVVASYLILFLVAASEACENPMEDVGSSGLPWPVPVASGFVLSEVSAKLAMNVSMYLGPSAREGMGAVFVEESKPWKMASALAIAAGVCFLFTGLLSVILIAGIISSVVVTTVARRNFGGVTGDVFGAANEIGRLATLMVWVMVV